MNARTLAAVSIGLILGAFAGHTVASGGYGAFGLLLFWIVIGTFIVCRVADHNIILTGMLPNVVMVIVLSSDLQIKHPAGLSEVLLGFISWTALTTLLSLPVSVPIYLLRRYLNKVRLGKELRGRALSRFPKELRR